MTGGHARIELSLGVLALFAAVVPFGLVRCDASRDSSSPKDPRRDAGVVDVDVEEHLRARAVARLVAGVLGKPLREDVESTAFTFAPLFVVERAEAPSPSALEGVFEAETPGVYFVESTVLIDGDPYEQWTYCWRTGGSALTGDATSVRGIRMTLDGRGFPAVWEVLDDSPGRRPIYISTALEAAATEAFGEPLAGNLYAARTDRELAPEAVIVRAIEAGGTPLGPFVYLGATRGDVVSVICRCMPAQVDTVDETFDYRLEPLPEELASGVFAGTLVDPTWLERVIRWPPSW